ncbi:MAG: alpha/beta fold hydrolase [Desulfobacter sp.]|nr:MAG: alpha/beta fold hydrolase [Desulfobacter sp.]
MTYIDCSAKDDLMELETRSGYRKSEMSQWFKAETRNPEAVVLLIHGLNQKPSKWQALIDFFNSLKIHVFRLTLQGHGGAPFEDMMAVDANRWRSNFRYGYCELEKRYPSVKKILVAYSLGGLISQEYQLSIGTPLFSGQVLLAPSLSLQPYVHLIRPFTRIMKAIPSRTPVDYRANPIHTSSAAYRALFHMVRSINSKADSRAVNIKTIVLIHPDDEVVSCNGLKNMVKRKGLDRWQVKIIRNHKSRLDTDFKHMIIDRASLGDRGWAFVTRTMGDFITSV